MLQPLRRIALPIFSLAVFGIAANALMHTGNCDEGALVLQKMEAKKSIIAPNARILGILLESCQELCKNNRMLDQSELACSAFVFQKALGNCFFYSENLEPASIVDSSDSDLYRKQCQRAPTDSAGRSTESPNLFSSELRPQTTSTEESQKVEPAAPPATASATTGTAKTIIKTTEGNSVASAETAQPRQADDDQEADYDAALEASNLDSPSEAPAPEEEEVAPAKPPRVSAHMASSAEMQPPPPPVSPLAAAIPPPTTPAASRPVAAAASPAAFMTPISAANKPPAAASAAVVPIATTKAPPIAAAAPGGGTTKLMPIVATAAKIAATVKPVSVAPVAPVGAAISKLPQIIASVAPKVATPAPKAAVPAVGNATAKVAPPAAVLTTIVKPPVAASTAAKRAVTPYPVAANVTLPKGVTSAPVPVVPIVANATKAQVLPAVTLPVPKPGSTVAPLQLPKAPPVASPIYQTTKPVVASTAAGQFTPKPVAAQVIGQVTLRALVIMVPLEGDHVDPKAFPEITQIVGSLPLGKSLPLAAGIAGKIANSSETVGGALSANRSVLGATQPPRSAEMAKDAANVTTAKFRISTHAILPQSSPVAVTLQPPRPAPAAVPPSNPNGKRSSSEVAASPSQVASSEKSSENGPPVAHQEATNDNLQGLQEEMGANDEKVSSSGLRRRNLNSCKYALKFFECLRAQKQIWMHHNANNAADVV